MDEAGPRSRMTFCIATFERIQRGDRNAPAELFIVGKVDASIVAIQSSANLIRCSSVIRRCR